MKKLLLSASLLLGLSSANADTITGGIALFGNSYADFGARTVEFVNTSITLQPYYFGDFAAFGPDINGSVTLNWQNLNTDIPWAGLGSNSNLGCGPTCIISFSNSATGAGGFVNVTQTFAGPFAGFPPSLIAVGFGIFTGTGSLSGYDPTPGLWSMYNWPVDNPLAPTGWWQVWGFEALDHRAAGAASLVTTPIPGGIGLSLLFAFPLLWLCGRRRFFQSVGGQ
jgi:hypothetical protein